MPYQPIEQLTYSIELMEERGGGVEEILARLADIEMARAAFRVAVKTRPRRLIMLCVKARVLQRSDQPPEWV